MSYSSVFGGDTINPAQLSYARYTIDADLRLVWPYLATESTDPAAAKLSIEAEVAGLSVYMPPADQVSVGQDVLVKNVGVETITIKDYDGGVIGSVASGLSWYYYVTDNADAAGTWDSVQFGAGTSNASAASLAGSGLRAEATYLDQNLPVTSLAANYTLAPNDRATVVYNNGGAVTWSFSPAATLGNGWLVYVINGDGGNITLDPSGGETIDGDSTKVLAPGESCVVFSDGANLHTLGYGRSLVTTVTSTSVSLAPGGTVVLSNSQIAAQIQDFNGALVSNAIVEYGTGVGYWFVWNNTTGAFSTTFRVDSLDAGVVVPQGNFSILRSNGTNMEVAFTSTVGTVTQINTTAGELTGGPITTTGTLGLANTAVISGTYGSASQTVTATVDQKGRLTALAQQAIAIGITQVTPFTSAVLRGQITDETGGGLAVFNDAPTLINPVVGTQSPGDDTTKAASTEFVNDAIAAAVAGLGFFTTGDLKHTANPAGQSGWIFLDGKTIGNASSGATGRANNDTLALFTMFYDNYSDTICPVSGGRGANAATDFAANKTITILDLRGRTLAAIDNLGGSAASRLTNTTMTPNGTTMGATGGGQTNSFTYSGLTSATGTKGVGISTGETAAPPGQQLSYNGTTNAGSVVQPTLLCTILVKL